jgi:hypothetical protein
MMFKHYIGIDYSGAETPTSSLKGLRVYMASALVMPMEILPPAGPKRYWTRQGVAHWLLEQLSQSEPIIVGIDHGFSFPMRYFQQHGLKHDWHAFLLDFRHHWPTHKPLTYVDFCRFGPDATGVARGGNTKWRRLTELRAGAAKSVFHFDVNGSVAKSTHSGLPWLLFIREQFGERVHFWPFDGWLPPEGKSVIVEAYPRLFSAMFPVEDRTGDQHDAYAVAAWLQAQDDLGSLPFHFQPELNDRDRKVADVEGWIIGLTAAPDAMLPKEKPSTDGIEQTASNLPASTQSQVVMTISISRDNKALATVESISGKALPLLYGSEVAEHRVRRELSDIARLATRMFVVNIDVQSVRGVPVAYRVLAVQSVEDIQDAEQ